MGVALAAALPALDYDCGLGTASLFTADVAEPPLAPRAGALAVGRVSAEPALLAAHEASADRRQWWLDRLTRCYAVLDAAR
jgi:O-succinylbenzoate synthase